MMDELSEFAKSLDGLTMEEMRELLKDIRKSRIEKVQPKKSPIDTALRRKVMNVRDLISDDEEFVI